MIVRALLLLALLIAASVALTVYFGAEIVVALGLILLQVKLLLGKVGAIKLPAVIVWLKDHASDFARIELIKKWLTTTLMPLVLGSVFLRRIDRFIGTYREALAARYARLLDWFNGLDRHEKLAAGVIVVLATLWVSGATLGLWLVLFSVKLPFWMAAAAATLSRMVWASVQKMLFNALAFMQLTRSWNWLRRKLPEAYLERKRRFDFRVARMVVRQRRLTLRELTRRKHGLMLRLDLIRGYFRQDRPKLDDD